MICIGSHVNKEQRDFVAGNKDGLVHAYIRMTTEKKQVFPFGIYLGKKPIGFIMIAYDVGEDDGTEPSAEWFLRNSYSFPAGEATYCWLSYEPTNEVAKKLYLSFGFEEHPEHYEEGEEMPAVLKL